MKKKILRKLANWFKIDIIFYDGLSDNLKKLYDLENNYNFLKGLKKAFDKDICEKLYNGFSTEYTKEDEPRDIDDDYMDYINTEIEAMR